MRKHLGPWSLTSLVVLLVWSCQSPLSGASTPKAEPGTVTISLSTARTVVADLHSLITSYGVTLTCPGLTSLTGTATAASPSVSIPSVSPGTWTVNVIAYNGATPVAAGSSTVVVALGSTPTLTVTVSALQGGQGNYSLTCWFPTSVGITSVVGTLYTSAGAMVGSPVTIPAASFVAQTGGNTSCTFAQSNITAANYRLELTFYRNAVVAGDFSEAVNVWNNVTSDQWWSPSGTLQNYATFTAANFNSSDATLSNLTSSGTLSPTFASTTWAYTVASGTSAAFTPTCTAGKAIAYQLNSTTGPWTPLPSGTTSPAVIAGNTINVRVTASDGVTQQLYSVSVGAFGPVSTTFQFAGYQAVTFAATSPIQLGQSVSFAPIFGAGTGTSYQWYNNGASAGTSSSYTFTPSAPGYYAISVSFLFNGVLYSGSTNLTVGDQGIVMVSVPGGTFQRDSGSANLSTVSPFLISKFDITQAQYQAVMGSNPSYYTGATHPVDRISWYAAIAFCNTLSLAQGLTPVYTINGSTNPASWLGVPTSLNPFWSAAIMDRNANGYRLPTEMEWMWAAMGATSDSFGYPGSGTNTTGYAKPFAGYNGTNTATNYAWYDWSATGGPNSTSPVGQKLPNELGLFDMSGNAWQWCWDMSQTFPNGALTDYAGGFSGSLREIRGGAYGADVTTLSPSYQSLAYPPYTASGYYDHSFRVVRSNGGQYIPTDHLVGQWMFAGDATDTSGFSPASPHNGTVSGATLALDRKGNSNSAYSFTLSDSISITDPTLQFSTSQSFSLSVWFFTNATSGNLVGQLGNTGEYQYSLSLSSTGIYAWLGQYNVGAIARVNSLAPVTGAWHHAVLVCNPSVLSLTLYVDGVSQGTAVFVLSSASAPSTSFYLGANTFVGSLSGLRIYNRALTAAEVTALYRE